MEKSSEEVVVPPLESESHADVDGVEMLSDDVLHEKLPNDEAESSRAGGAESTDESSVVALRSESATGAGGGRSTCDCAELIVEVEAAATGSSGEEGSSGT